jgi:predicted dehydrogenase
MPLRLGMLGLWHTHADGMTRQIVAHPEEFTLVGGYESDADTAAARRRQWADRYGSFRLFDSLAELLRQPIDAVVVEGRVFENLAYAQAAIDSGRPVLLEKPAGTRLAEFEALADSARARRLHLQLTYLFRYMPAVREMLARAGRGDLGNLYEFRARLPKDLSLYADLVEELRPYPGGVFFEMAGHMIDILVTLLGPPRRIQAVLGHHHPAPPAEFVDNGAALFECERAIGVVAVPALEVVPSSRRFEVYGTGGGCVIPHLGSGHLRNDSTQPLLVCQAGWAEWQRIDLPAEPLQIRDLREFADVIAGRKQPDYSLEHDLIVQESLLRACGMSTAGC